MQVTVNGNTTPENGVVAFTMDLAGRTSGGTDKNFGFDPAYGIYCAFVDTGDGSSVDPGADARVDSYRFRRESKYGQ